jgi:hypothetical protein
MKKLLPILAVLAAACAQDAALGGDSEATDGVADTATVSRPSPTFRISVEPADAGTLDNPVLPAVFGPFLAADGLSLELRPAVHLTGHLQGLRATSWSSARLPATVVDVPADIALEGATAGVHWRTESNDAGLYDLAVAPDLYQIRITPKDPLLPPWTAPLPIVGARRLDVAVGMGRPLWGRLVDGDGAPIGDAKVVATDDTGLRTAAAVSNADGWYELHVPDGMWRVVVEPPAGRRLPTRAAGPVEVGEPGARLDASWQVPVRATLRVHLTDAVGDSLTQATIAVTSASVEGYPLGSASFSLTVATDSQGFLETSVPAGVYALELLPGQEDRWAPLKLGDLAVVDELDLGTIAADGFNPAVWTARDLDGVPLAGAVTTCTELGGTHRRWAFDADEAGRINVTLPNTSLDCLFMPPGDRPELAALRAQVDHPTEVADFALGAGDRVSGSVLLVTGGRRVPSAYAVVRVLADDDTVLAQGATDGDGQFTLSVPPAE